MLTQRTALSLIGGIFLIASFFGIVHTSYGQAGKSSDVTVLQLNQQIQDRKNKISALRKQIEAYQSQIKVRQSQRASLENQISLIEDQLEKTKLDIEATQDEIEQLNLEVEQATLEIEDKEENITAQKERIAELVRALYKESQKDYLEILLMNERFSDFFDSIRSLEDVQGGLQKTVLAVQELREQLLVQKASLENNRLRQEKLKEKLVQEKGSMEDQKHGKQTLVVQSVLSQEKYERLLSEARAEQAEINSDIVNLEKVVREKMKLLGNGTASLMWPIDPSRGISTYFRDPGYPFRHVFEHPGLDVRAYQGTYIKSPEDGYVARVKFDGSKAYSYVMIVHRGGLATVFGHVSRPIVAQDTYVKKGQVVALTGGAPGSVGAGNLTTGPHLHFEVRLNGIPVDPLKYLP